MRGASRWLAWGALVAVLGVVLVWAFDALFGHDVVVWLGALAGLVCVVPFVLSLRSAGVARAADRALVLTLSAAALNRGLLYLQQKRYAEATSDLQQALDSGAKPSLVHYNFALLHRARGKKTEARASLLRALEDDPNFKAARDLLDLLGR